MKNIYGDESPDSEQFGNLISHADQVWYVQVPYFLVAAIKTIATKLDKKILAIQFTREHTGMGLMEAKLLVEAIMRGDYVKDDFSGRFTVTVEL